MLKQLIQAVAAISPSMSNTIYASLAWSGATRAVNAITFDAPQDEVDTYLALAGLAKKVTVPDLRPTTETVMSLLESAPEQEAPTKTSMKILEQAGEDMSKLDATLESDHEIAMQRHDKQLRRLEVHRELLESTLDKAFAATTKKFPDVSEDLEQALIDKIMQKVQARRSRLVVDITSGRNAGFAPKELAAINVFLREQAA